MDWINEHLITENDYAFIYIIKNLSNGRSYIGSKVLFFKRKVKLSKKKKKLLGTRKQTEIKIKESDWRTYTGSNKQLNEDIKNGDIIEKKILKVVQTKKQKSYWEAYYQFCEDVLGSDAWYNENLMGRYYGRDINE